MAAGVTLARPDRGPKRNELLALLARFQAAGLQASVSTNGSNPDADIEVDITPATQRERVIHAVTVTAAGRARLG